MAAMWISKYWFEAGYEGIRPGLLEKRQDVSKLAHFISLPGLMETL